MNADLDLRIEQIENPQLSYSIGHLYYILDRGQYNYRIGIQILDWDLDEKFWQINAVNSNRAFGLMDREQEGIAGLLYSGGNNDLEWQTFFSLIYLPNSGARIKIDNGKVKSTANWPVLPPDSV